MSDDMSPDEQDLAARILNVLENGPEDGMAEDEIRDGVTASLQRELAAAREAIAAKDAEIAALKVLAELTAENMELREANDKLADAAVSPCSGCDGCPPNSGCPMNDCVIADCMDKAILSARSERDALRDTLKRIGREIVAVAPDSGKWDSVGEIYHLLRECGALEER